MDRSLFSWLSNEIHVHSRGAGGLGLFVPSQQDVGFSEDQCNTRRLARILHLAPYPPTLLMYFDHMVVRGCCVTGCISLRGVSTCFMELIRHLNVTRILQETNESF